MAKYIYLSGLIIYVAALFLPAYSVYGVMEQTGWETLQFLTRVDFSMIWKMKSLIELVNFSVLILSSVNNLFVIASPVLFPVRNILNRNTWFPALILTGILSLVYITIMFWMMDEIDLKAGFYLWCMAIAMVYLSLKR